jgi:UMF1 family MFS transporter
VEYFGVYEVGQRSASWLAPLACGLTLQLTQSYRLALLSLTVFISLGLALLARVDLRKGAAEAGNELPRLV